MATLTITVDDELLARLRERAAESDVDPESVATAILSSALGTSREEAVSAEAIAIMDRQIARYKRVFDRLAQ